MGTNAYGMIKAAEKLGFTAKDVQLCFLVYIMCMTILFLT